MTQRNRRIRINGILSSIDALSVHLLTSFLVIFLLSTPCVIAWNEPTGFRNIPWGTRPEVVRQHFPDFRCEQGIKHDTIRNSCRGDLKVGTIQVFAIIAYETGGMDSVSLHFTPEDFAEMKAIFIERYGQPTETSAEPVQNRMGAKFVNKILRWSGTVTSIRLEKYSTTITESIAILTTRDAMKFMLEHKQKRAKAGKKDL
jgi:hypothetical protein